MGTLKIQRTLEEVADDPKWLKNCYRVCRINRKGKVVNFNQTLAGEWFDEETIHSLIDELKKEYKVTDDQIVVLRQQFVVVNPDSIKPKKKPAGPKRLKEDKLDSDSCWKLFSYATSIAEDVSEFIDKEINSKELLKRTYGKETKAWLKRNFKRYGVEKTRRYLSLRIKAVGDYRY